MHPVTIAAWIRELESPAHSRLALPPLPSRKRAWPNQCETSVNEPFWTENGTWPTEDEDKTMDGFRGIVEHVLARKKSSASLCHKRSYASINTETAPTRTPSDQQAREQKTAPYRHPLYKRQFSERGSFMGRFSGISTGCIKLCQTLLESPQSPPQDTLFENSLFEGTLERIKGRNETRVIRDIAHLIVPPAETLPIRGTKHLKILREATNADWYSCVPLSGLRPQPDYSLSFKIEDFNPERLWKLHPLSLDLLRRCGASTLDIADRQNAHSQTVALRGLFKLFRLVSREKELHNKISGFSISHSDVNVRIAQADNIWIAWTAVMNILDLWVPDYLKWICSAIDILPTSWDLEVSERLELLTDPELDFPLSGLHQKPEE
ncbi:hypothetical protein K458DRAFT_437888 [Lentithecium fluviatile CBS 122367]|uniref:DUF7924 domain-containing protein n=1 Tax=Lentithecium fluviatile CBS 122367 TaxID=1168545 RepID=A0A6G1JLF5_9PLEO|nr:hypothetical protein K458DRAFT_437888 [Lentithecium fluviatile CBS 122367]